MWSVGCKKYFLACFLACFWGGLPCLQAHPVIYKGGWVLWSEAPSNIHRISYTWHPHAAVEFKARYSKKGWGKSFDNNGSAGPQQAYTLGFNFLLKRWLFEDSQANIYTSLGGGLWASLASSDAASNTYEKPSALAYLSVDMDWESRHWYTALHFGSSVFRPTPAREATPVAKAPPIIKSLAQRKVSLHWLYNWRYRLGFAPYLGGMDELQTWFVLQYNHNFQLTPLLRFFYKNVLWEMGATLKGKPFLTLMVHY